MSKAKKKIKKKKQGVIREQFEAVVFEIERDNYSWTTRYLALRNHFLRWGSELDDEF